MIFSCAELVADKGFNRVRLEATAAFAQHLPNAFLLG